MTFERPVQVLISDTVWRTREAELRSAAPGIVPVIYEGNEPLGDELLNGVEVAFVSQDTWPERVRGISISVVRSPALRWLHSFSAGVDSPFFVQLIERGVTVTTSSGASSTPIAHTVMLYILALSRDMRGWMRKQDRREWQQHQLTEIEGTRLAVIGLGPIGIEVARLGLQFGMVVEGVRRSPTGDEPCTTRRFEEMPDVLGRADWVVLALPLTHDTRRMFDADMLARIKPGARFINVGRGELVDETALVAALQSGRLAGAGLDVFEVEPLPADSPLWAMDNVIVSPHNSASTGSAGERSTDIFVDNLGRYVRDLPLRNIAGT